jgi:hypothetical protein
LFHGDKEKYNLQIKSKLEVYKNWKMKLTPLMKN